MFTEKNREELNAKGYTVVPNVVSANFCDECITQYDQWLSKFTKTGEWPRSFNSMIQRYRVGHFEPTWKLRLACLPVFTRLWGTEKLLTSIDAIAVGRAPETGAEPFQDPDKHWLHCDQPGNQKGIHTFQGALYLEDADQDDWTFYVMESSHQHTDEFYATHPQVMSTSVTEHHYTLSESDVDWFSAKGSVMKRIPVSKGGLALWDSRLIHANSRPLEGRKHPNRIRRMTFVSMAPAIWASEEDLKLKRDAYHNLLMTPHWPSQSVALFIDDVPSGYPNVPATDELPDVAKTDEAKRLCGVMSYDFNDGQPNGPDWEPNWIGGYRSKYGDEAQCSAVDGIKE